MKKTVLMLAAAGLMLFTPSCKKGENDPFLSLKSRKGRLAGEYNITGWDQSETYTDANGDVTTTTATLSGTTITQTQVYTPSGGGSSVTTTTTINLDEASMSITKDGTYSFTWNTTSTWTDEYSSFGYTQTTDYTQTETRTESGSWNFLGKVDEYKNKERAVFNMTQMESTSQTNDTWVLVEDASGNQVDSGSNTGDIYASNNTYQNGEYPTVYAIDQLKGKEVIMKMESGGSSTWSTTSGSTTTTSTDTDTGMLTFTMTAK